VVTLHYKKEAIGEELGNTQSVSFGEFTHALLKALAIRVCYVSHLGWMDGPDLVLWQDQLWADESMTVSCFISPHD
jgi:hypothetical protein